MSVLSIERCLARGLCSQVAEAMKVQPSEPLAFALKAQPVGWSTLPESDHRPRKVHVWRFGSSPGVGS
jgi:hypothetical protein